MEKNGKHSVLWILALDSEDAYQMDRFSEPRSLHLICRKAGKTVKFDSRLLNCFLSFCQLEKLEELNDNKDTLPKMT